MYSLMLHTTEGSKASFVSLGKIGKKSLIFVDHLTKIKPNDNLKMNFETVYMQLQTISVKELRTNMPKIIKALKKGSSYTLIHRSKPVAEIKPVSSSQEGLKRLLELGPSFHFRSKKSAVELIREERD